MVEEELEIVKAGDEQVINSYYLFSARTTGWQDALKETEPWVGASNQCVNASKLCSSHDSLSDGTSSHILGAYRFWRYGGWKS
jgi:hypothetical protein